jgi:dTDP-4-dehydrorhamnose reductase
MHEMLAGENVFVTYHSNPIVAKDSFQLDITDRSQVEKVFRDVSPGVIIHTAAFTNVDGCESQKEKARMVNAEGARNVAIEAKKYGAKLVYISTDYVFDGHKGMYKEGDVTNPINHYGLTKLQGEQAVVDVCDDFIIARTSVLYGRGRKNFTTWIIDELKNRKELTIVTDQFVSPTLNTDLSHQIIALIEADAAGIYHTAGAERISRFDFAQKVAEGFELDPDLIVPYASERMNWLAKRPMDSSLDVSKVSKVRKPLRVHEAIKTLRGEMS